jgi:hypothetical protein
MAISLINTECKRYGCMKNLLACYANCRYSSKCDDLRNEILDRTEQAAGDINAYLKERGKQPVMIQILKRGLKFTETDAASRKQTTKKILPAFNAAAKLPEELKLRSSAAPEPRKVFASPRLKPARRPLNDNLSKKPRRAALLELNIAKATKPAAKIKAAKIKTGRPTSYLDNDLISTGKKVVAGKGKKGRELGKSNKPSQSLKVRQRKNAIMPRKLNNESIEVSSQKESAANASSNGTDHAKSVKSPAPRARTGKRFGGSSRARTASRKGSLYIIIEGKSANIVDEQGLMQHILSNPSATARYFEASEVEARVQIMPKK